MKQKNGNPQSAESDSDLTRTFLFETRTQKTKEKYQVSHLSVDLIMSSSMQNVDDSTLTSSSASSSSVKPAPPPPVSNLLAPVRTLYKTPRVAIDSAVALLQLDTNDVLADIGCGDGNVLIEAVRMSGCRAIGVEIDEERAKLAQRAVQEAGLQEKIQILCGECGEWGGGQSRLTL